MSIVLRKISQIVFFIGFLTLFFLTIFISSNTVNYLTHIFLSIDPLIVLFQGILFKTIIASLMPAIITIVLTVLSIHTYWKICVTDVAYANMYVL